MQEYESSVQSILGEHANATSKSGPGIEDEYKAFTFGRVGTHSQAMLTFIKHDDYVEAISYANLRRIWSSDIEKQLNLDFGDRQVVIDGSNLQSLFQYICSNRCSEIIEKSKSEAITSIADQPVVIKLVIGVSK